MEYIPGFDFNRVLYERAHMYLHPDIMKGYNLEGAPLLEVMGQSLIDYDLKEAPLVVLGKMVISDVIMNNPDRLPAIWPNKGNQGNLMVEIMIESNNYGKDAMLSSPSNLQYMNMINLCVIDN